MDLKPHKEAAPYEGTEVGASAPLTLYHSRLISGEAVKGGWVAARLLNVMGTGYGVAADLSPHNMHQRA